MISSTLEHGLNSDMISWYNGKNMLITGATGYIGKVCLEKVLRTFENSGKIYILIRSKQDQTASDRVNRMLSREPFQINKINHKLFEKIIPIEGDMSCENLGLDDETKRILVENVNIVFNIAASVQFDAPLKQNLRDNYLGCRNLLELSSEFYHLDSYVHVSTFYTNSHESHQYERVKPMKRDCEELTEFIQWLPDEICDDPLLMSQIMEERPNSYIFTKAMSENLVQKYQGQFPISIIRPSIVMPSAKEPMPAWVDNVNGPIGLTAVAALGILRTIDWNYYGVVDFIPVDFVVNCMLVVARRSNLVHPKQVEVYNVSTSSLNPLTWGDCFENLRISSMKAPPYKMLRYPIEVPKYKRANRIKFEMTKLFSEILFAYFVDFILMLCGKKPILKKMTSKLHHAYNILLPFTTNEYKCSNENFIHAYEELSQQDKKIFNFDVRNINWNKLMELYYGGIRRFILKERPESIPRALIKMKLLYMMECIGILALYTIVGLASFQLLKLVGITIYDQIMYEAIS